MDDVTRYFVEDAIAKKDTPYSFFNPERAEAVFFAIRERMPEAEFVVIGCEQYILLTKKAKNKLRKQLRSWITERENKLDILRETLRRLEE